MFSLVITLVVAALSFGLGVAVAGRAVRGTVRDVLERLDHETRYEVLRVYREVRWDDTPPKGA